MSTLSSRTHSFESKSLLLPIVLTSDHINNFCFVVLPFSEKKFTRFSEARRAKFLPWPNFFIIIIASLFCNNRTNLNLMCRNKATLYLKVVTFIQNIWPLAEIKVCCHTGQTSWRGPRNTMQFYAGRSCHFVLVLLNQPFRYTPRTVERGRFGEK